MSVCVRLCIESTEFVEGGAFVKIVLLLLLLLLLLLYVSCLSHHGRPGSYQSVNDKAACGNNNNNKVLVIKPRKILSVVTQYSS